MGYEPALASLKDVLYRVIASRVLPKGAYLAGGTALYFYFGHRLSVDLDFFCPEAFRSEYLAARFGDIFEATAVEIIQEDTLILTLGVQKTKLSLFRLPYLLLKPLAVRPVDERTNCPLASLDDIAAMKAVAVIQRGTAKDFVDLHRVLLESEYSFSQLAELVKTKYRLGDEYDYHLKTALAYFDDAESDSRSILLLEKGEKARPMAAEEWEAVQGYFLRFVR